ncbi:MAG TPA: PorP/SprF family type IX secretion system membrane protein [Saprospiraceae bacterium]|nr:PorP/SprF family type IX secretion system membrane protein [Saprospiraceae bacterium]
MKVNISIAGVIFYFLVVTSLSAQDIHLSQYHFDRLQINPALTGMFNGDKQMALLYKSQWANVPVEYSTFSGSFDMKLRKTQTPKGFFSIGGLFNYDQAGDGNLSLGSLTFNGSYTRALSKSFFVTLGGAVGGGQRKFDITGLLFESQWVMEQPCPTCPNNENFESSFFYLDLSGGINLRLQGKDRTKIDLGVGAFHLNEPTYTFSKTGDDTSLPIRTAFSALGVLKLANRLDLYGNGLLQQQGPYEETLAGGGVIIHISNKKAREVELHLGVATRFDDAIIPMIALGYDGWKGGFSYDITTSPFQTANNQKGGPEFFLTYTYKKLWPLEQTKVCSIF